MVAGQLQAGDGQTSRDLARLEQACDLRRSELNVATGCSFGVAILFLRRVRPVGAEADTVRNDYSADLLERDCCLSIILTWLASWLIVRKALPSESNGVYRGILIVPVWSKQSWRSTRMRHDRGEPDQSIGPSVCQHFTEPQRAHAIQRLVFIGGGSEALADPAPS